LIDCLIFKKRKSKSKRINLTRTSFSDSPLHLEERVEDEILKKVVPHSLNRFCIYFILFFFQIFKKKKNLTVATAFAKRVFPVPGGPVIKTPFHGRRIP